MTPPKKRYPKASKSEWFLAPASPESAASENPAPAKVIAPNGDRDHPEANTSNHTPQNASSAIVPSWHQHEVEPDSERPYYRAADSSLPPKAHPNGFVKSVPLGTKQAATSFTMPATFQYRDPSAASIASHIGRVSAVDLAQRSTFASRPTFGMGQRQPQPPLTDRRMANVGEGGDRRMSPNDRRDIPTRAPTISPTYSIN
ncbi:hypothetical protein BJ875DRAFT_459976 [Amylocarpus encephaloides]|uniref:Uncharacterized protein n=1 Tax=Amylocarpus encephaloides TaxID=45428 RepID=A0A9P7YJX2_9HELO|nr:hypothetical protein BJ875DRAFT_459976 [Amylocarpus encephaloides]